MGENSADMPHFYLLLICFEQLMRKLSIFTGWRSGLGIESIILKQMVECSLNEGRIDDNED